jgi:hypothetical protein
MSPELSDALNRIALMEFDIRTAQAQKLFGRIYEDACVTVDRDELGRILVTGKKITECFIYPKDIE